MRRHCSDIVLHLQRSGAWRYTEFNCHPRANRRSPSSELRTPNSSRQNRRAAELTAHCDRSHRIGNRINCLSNFIKRLTIAVSIEFARKARHNRHEETSLHTPRSTLHAPPTPHTPLWGTASWLTRVARMTAVCAQSSTTAGQSPTSTAEHLMHHHHHHSAAHMHL